MYQAAIVEDDAAILEYLKNTLIQEFDKKGTTVAFDAFTSGTRFLEMYEAHYHYDVLFLDIEMPKINGIDVCKKIREFSSDSLVVFISNKEELVFQTFEVQPFRFIRKEAFENTVTSLVVSILNKWLQNKGRLLQLQENGSNDLYSFSIPHILYIEAQRKDCLIVTTEGTCVFRCRLMELEEKLADCHFIKIHRSYLVNCMHIFRIGKSFVQLTNGTELPISRGKTEEIKQLFLQYNTTY